MTPRSARETLDSLRVTLQKLEQTSDSSSDGKDISELKQILLNRIAELETLQAIEPSEEAVAAPSPGSLPPIAAEAEPLKEVDGADGLKKMD